MDAEPKSITYSITPEDWKQVCGTLYLMHLKWWASYLYAPVLVALNLYLHQHPALYSRDTVITDNVIYLAVVAAWNLRVAWRYHGSGRKMFHLAPELFEGITCEISDKGLTLRRGEDRLTKPWKIYQRVLRTPKYILVCKFGYGQDILPRRCFPDGGKSWLAAIATAIHANKVSDDRL